MAAFRVDPAGVVSVIVSSNSNGVALSPDEKKLYILEAGTWDLDPLGAPSNPGPIAPSGDGLAVDCAGDLYASGTIYNAQGQRIGAYPSGSDLTFGGADGKTLFIVGTGTQVQEVQMNLPGLP